jgi:hypothetical protein
MTNTTVKISEGDRSPTENEFFFYNDPYRTSGVRELMEYLQENHGFEFEEIPHWQIRSIVKGAMVSTTNYGLRIKIK